MGHDVAYWHQQWAPGAIHTNTPAIVTAPTTWPKAYPWVSDSAVQTVQRSRTCHWYRGGGVGEVSGLVGVGNEPLVLPVGVWDGVVEAEGGTDAEGVGDGDADVHAPALSLLVVPTAHGVQLLALASLYVPAKHGCARVDREALVQ